MTTINLTIAVNVQDYDIYVQAGAPAGVVDVIVTVNSGVTVQGASGTGAMYQSGSFAGGSTVKIINNGTIVGRGGDAGDGGAPGENGKPGSNGTQGINLGQNTTLDNTNGTVHGGGGGGGGGAGTISGGGGGGGGGQGRAGGSKGAKGSAGCTAATNGNYAAAGIHGNGEFSGGNGGNGGSFESDGVAGVGGGGNLGGAKGAGVAAIRTNGYILTQIQTVVVPLLTITPSILIPTINFGGGITAPLMTITQTIYVPTNIGFTPPAVGFGNSGGILQKPPFNDGNTPTVMWNWFLRVWQWAAKQVSLAATQTASFTTGLAYYYPVDATSGNLVVTLPAATTQNGKKYVIKKTDASANTVTVTANTNAPDLIDGAATKVLSVQYATLEIQSDGVSNWNVLAGSAVAGSSLTSPLTTKGDVWVYSTTDARIAVGTDGQALLADSTQTTGLKWGLAVPAFTKVTATGAGTTAAVPTGYSACEIILQGPGGGGNTQNSTSGGGGGGSGEFMRRTIPVTAGQTYNYNVGTAGTNSANGSDTTFTGDTTVWTAKAGQKGSSSNQGGNGGGRSGPVGGNGAGAAAVVEGVDAISGASGGGGGANSTTSPGTVGGACEENAGAAGGLGHATTLGGGGGGGSSRFGIGGTGGTNNGAGNSPAATAYGAAGGGGASSNGAGAAGIQGVIFYRWV